MRVFVLDEQWANTHTHIPSHLSFLIIYCHCSFIVVILFLLSLSLFSPILSSSFFLHVWIICLADDISDILPLTKATQTEYKRKHVRFGTQLVPRSLPYNASEILSGKYYTHLKEQSCGLLLKMYKIEKSENARRRNIIMSYVVFSREMRWEKFVFATNNILQNKVSGSRIWINTSVFWSERHQQGFAFQSIQERDANQAWLRNVQPFEKINRNSDRQCLPNAKFSKQYWFGLLTHSPTHTDLRYWYVRCEKINIDSRKIIKND